MELSFECSCGADVSDFVRGDGDVNTRFRCDDCGTVYAVTVSALN